MVNTWLLRRYKRRALCIISSLGMAVCMTVSGYFTLNIRNGDRSGYWVSVEKPRMAPHGERGSYVKPTKSRFRCSQVPVLCLLLYVCTSMVGMLTIPWTMTAELFPTEIRGIAHSISYSMANLLMFAALQSYRSLQAFLGGTYVVCCGLAPQMIFTLLTTSAFPERAPREQVSCKKIIKINVARIFIFYMHDCFPNRNRSF